MDAVMLKRNLPTFFEFVERLKKALQKPKLPKHLQPFSLAPLYVQLGLNSALIVTNLWLIWNKDEFMTDVGPAIPMTICLLFLFFVAVSAFQMRTRFVKGRGSRLAKLNL